MANQLSVVPATRGPTQDHRVLVLGPDERPLRCEHFRRISVSWQLALSWQFNGRPLEVVEYYQDVYARTNRGAHYPIPAVVRFQDVPEDVLVRMQDYPVATRPDILLRQGYMCAYTGADLRGRDDVTFDHILPASRGGPWSWENIVACTRAANQFKDDRTPDEAGMALLAAPYTPTLGDLAQAYLNLGRRFPHPVWVDFLLAA